MKMIDSVKPVAPYKSCMCGCMYTQETCPACYMKKRLAELGLPKRTPIEAIKIIDELEAKLAKMNGLGES
jgi:hypothetical protein